MIIVMLMISSNQQIWNSITSIALIQTLQNQYGTCPNGQVGQKVNVEPCSIRIYIYEIFSQ
jgi:hypothetical protein